MSKTNNGANLGFENQMWAAADKLRGHMDASEYKHVVLGLIFLKYISDAFQAKYKQLEATKDTEYTEMLEKFEVVVSMFHGFDYLSILKAEPTKRIAGIAAAMEHILQLDDGKKRYLTEVTALSKAFALAVPHEEALKIRDEVGFFQEVRAGLAKATVEGEGKSPEEMDTAIRQLVSRAVASEEVIEELIKLAKEMREAQRRGDDLGMTDDEIAFYDALEVNDSAVKVLGLAQK